MACRGQLRGGQLGSYVDLATGQVGSRHALRGLALLGDPQPGGDFSEQQCLRNPGAGVWTAFSAKLSTLSFLPAVVEGSLASSLPVGAYQCAFLCCHSGSW